MPIYSKYAYTDSDKKTADFYVTAIQAVYLKFLSRTDAKKNKYSVLCFLLACKLAEIEIVITPEVFATLEASNKDGYKVDLFHWKLDVSHDSEISTDKTSLKLKDGLIEVVSEDEETKKLFDKPAMTLLHLLGIFDECMLEDLMKKVGLPFLTKPSVEEKTTSMILDCFKKSLDKKYFANGSEKFVKIAEMNKVEFSENKEFILKYFDEMKSYADNLIKNKENVAAKTTSDIDSI
jgi:hypothetical protein